MSVWSSDLFIRLELTGLFSPFDGIIQIVNFDRTLIIGIHGHNKELFVAEGELNLHSHRPSNLYVGY